MGVYSVQMYIQVLILTLYLVDKTVATGYLDIIHKITLPVAMIHLTVLLTFAW